MSLKATKRVFGTFAMLLAFTLLPQALLSTGEPVLATHPSAGLHALQSGEKGTAKFAVPATEAVAVAFDHHDPPPGYPCGCCYQEFNPWPNYWHQQFQLTEWTDQCAGGGHLRSNDPEGPHSDMRAGSCFNGSKHVECDGMLLSEFADIALEYRESGDLRRLVDLAASSELVAFSPDGSRVVLLGCDGSGSILSQMSLGSRS
jgi:hypothetical protein